MVDLPCAVKHLAHVTYATRCVNIENIIYTLSYIEKQTS